jgi:nucleotide-binding universal stress UspA family protein
MSVETPKLRSRTMNLKDILVCLDPTAAGEARLHLAVSLARSHHAHLSAAYVLPEAIPGAARPAGGTGVPTGLAWLPGGAAPAHRAASGEPPAASAVVPGAELAGIIEQRFREQVQPHAIEGDWHLFEAGEGAELAARVGAADLAVFGQTSPDYRLPAGFRPEDVIVGSGRPMLVVPYTSKSTTVGRRVLVAWDSTREASRALHDALPLIVKAETVTVLTLSTREAGLERATPALDRVIRHLERHGITAQPEETLRGDLPVAEALLSRAADLDADLIVAGAYHHSQFREALVGGVSRALLDHMTVPVLMSH